MITDNTQDLARSYIKQGWAPIPIPAGSKAPKLKGWPQLTIVSNAVDDYFDADCNIGVLLGDNSAGLIDVDLDCREAVLAAEVLLPSTRVFGRADNPASHYLYQAPGTGSCTFDDPRSKRKVLLELRGTGKQTVFPGSVHPSGNRIEFANKRKVGSLTPARLEVLAGQVAAAALLGIVMDSWDTGRHNACLALTGAALHGGLSPRDTRNFMLAVINASGDDEPVDRQRVIEDTIKKYKDGGEVTGWPTLEGIFDAAVLNALRSWLNLTGMSQLTLGGKSLADAVGSATSSEPASVKRGPVITAQAGPEPLLREIEAGEVFPVAALGDVLAPMAQVMADIIKAPAGLCAQSVLGTAALVAQSHVDVAMDNFRYPISLFLLSIGKTGERKSTADKAAMGSVYAWQEDKWKNREEDLQGHKITRAAWEAAYEAGLKSAADGDKEEATRLLTAAGLEPTPPPNPTLIMSEPTYEGVVRHLEQDWPSAGIYSDEGGRFLGGYAMESKNMLRTAAGLSEVWDGKPISRVRAQENKLLFGRRVSMHLMVQPGVATIMMGSEELSDQGLLSRVLVSHPETVIGTRVYDETNLQQQPAVIKYNDAVKALLCRQMPWHDTLPHTLAPGTITIDGRARTNLIAYYNHIEPLQAAGQPLEHIAGLASKSMQQVMRIAAVLTLIEKPGAKKVSQYNLECAVDLVQHYLDEALRLREVSRDRPELLLAQRVLEWAQARPAVVVDGGEMVAVHLSQIYQYGPSRHIRDKDSALQIAEILEAHGWFERLPTDTQVDGTRRMLAWQVR